MVEEENGAGAPPPDDDDPGAGAATRRTVIKRERVLALPEEQDMSAEMLAEIAKVLGVKPKTLRLIPESWHVIGEFEGQSKDAAITAYTGPVGSLGAKLGVYKAPTSRGWAGGMRLKEPPRPRAEKEAID
jgi:hypothetical protein